MDYMAALMREIRNSYTFRLFKRPGSFCDGVASVIDVGSAQMNRYNGDPTNKLADFHSLEADWRAVGADMRSALEDYATENAL